MDRKVAVRRSLTPAEKAAENRRKAGKKGQHVPYTESVRKKMAQRPVKK